jgi:uncharacterized RDD family membrane protein YckC
MDSESALPAGPPIPPPIPPPPSTTDLILEGTALATLWRRAGAISIDALIWLIAAVPIALTHSSAPGGAFFFYIQMNGTLLSLSGIPLLVSLLAWLAYMTVMEATVGASVGKLATGMKVVGGTGDTPGWRASVGRNALRVVDVLPFFYIVGGIFAARSPKRQRLGDRAAGTLVVRRPPDGSVPVVPSAGEGEPTTMPAAKPARALVLGLALILLCVGVYSWVGRPGHGHYSREGLSFRYPTSWSPIVVNDNVTGNPPIFHDHIGVDAYDYVAAYGYRTSGSLTPQNKDATMSEFASYIQNLAEQSGGTVVTPPHWVTVAGLPAVAFSVAAELPNGLQERVDGSAVFGRGIEYQINCEYTSQQAAAIRQGCAQVMSTVHFQ